MLDTGYDYVGDFCEGFALVRINGKAGYIDANGEVAIPIDHDYTNDRHYVFPNFSEGLAGFYKNGKLGFVDKTGKVAINYCYEYAYTFNEGLCGVKNGKYGFIDKSGRPAVPFIYDMVTYFSEGLAPAKKDGKLGFIGQSGETAIPFVYEAEHGFIEGFSDGVALVKLNGKKGYIDRNGKAVVPFGLEFDSIRPFNNGLALVIRSVRADSARRKDENQTDNEKQAATEESRDYYRWGVINKTGKTVIPAEYDNIDYTPEGVVAENAGCQRFHDWTGKLLHETDYDRIGRFSEGMASARKGRNLFFIDCKGTVRISLGNTFDSADAFSEGYSRVKKGDRYGYIDRTGVVVAEPEFTFAHPVREGIAVVTKNNQWGLFRAN